MEQENVTNALARETWRVMQDSEVWLLTQDILYETHAAFCKLEADQKRDTRERQVGGTIPRSFGRELCLRYT